MSRGENLLNEVEDQARGHGFRKVRVHDGDVHRVMWQIACSVCGKEERHGWDVRTSPALMVKNMRKANWIVSKSPVCPDCRSKKMPKDLMNEASASAMVAGVIVPATKLMVEIIHKLDDVFDRERRLYAPGWSDEKVGAAIGASPEVVTRFRRDAYGELAEDPTITALRADIEALRAVVDDEIAKLTDRLAKLQSGHNKAAG